MLCHKLRRSIIGISERCFCVFFGIKTGSRKRAAKTVMEETVRPKPKEILYADYELSAIIDTALDAEKKILRKCYAGPVKEIGEYVRMLEEERCLLDADGEKDLAEHNGYALDLVTDLYAEYRKSLINLVYETSPPFDADGYIRAEQAEYRTITGIDQRTEGVYVFIEPRRIMLRIPPLPHRDKPEVWIDAGRRGQFPVTKTGIYREEVRRAFDLNPDLRILDCGAFAEKIIQYLNVIGPDQPNIMDNDNRDTTAVTNAICGYLPGGDSAVSCAFFHDGIRTDRLPAGTYVTVRPRQDGLLGREDVLAFWRESGLPEQNY